MGWSGLEALSKNRFILQPCSFLSGNDTVLFCFFLSGFSCLTILCTEFVCSPRALELICLPPSHAGQGAGQGAGSSGLDCTLSRRNIHTPVGISRGELLFLGGCWEFSAQFNLSPADPLPVLSVGIYGVGKAAIHPPALAVLSHTPEGATQTIAWVGKGIVYDTGGLSIKGKVRCWGQCLGGSQGGRALGGLISSQRHWTKTVSKASGTLALGRASGEPGSGGVGGADSFSEGETVSCPHSRQGSGNKKSGQDPEKSHRND